MDLEVPNLEGGIMGVQVKNMATGCRLPRRKLASTLQSQVINNRAVLLLPLFFICSLFSIFVPFIFNVKGLQGSALVLINPSAACKYIHLLVRYRMHVKHFSSF